MSKKCVSCGDVKPLDQFHAARHSRDGRYNKCKVCVSHWHREYNARPDVKAKKAPGRRKYSLDRYRADPVAGVAAVIARRKASPVPSLSRNLARALSRRPTENHVTVKELHQIWKDQDGKCAVWCCPDMGRRGLSSDVDVNRPD